MQAFTEWTDKLSVGNRLIDEEHRTLLKLGKLAYALANTPNPNPESLHAVLNNIATETMKHFEDEERVMAENNCPTLAEHHAAHTALLKQLTDYLCTVSKKSIDKAWVADFVNDLIVVHVVTMDLPNKAFIREHPMR